MQLVIFKIRDEFFGVEASRVLSINDMMTITRVPNAPKHIKGLINLRGIIISLFDISTLLNLTADYNNSKISENSNIIILDVDFEEVGIIVDKVDEVLDIDPNAIKKSIDSKLPFVKGILELNHKLITLIDINKFVSVE